MKKFFEKAKKSVLLYTIVLTIVFILLHFLLKLINIQFRQWVYYSMPLLSIIGFIVGIIQIVRKKSKKVKIIFSIIGLCIVITAIAFWQLILLFLAFSYNPEHIITKNEEKYVAYVHSFLDVDVYYYDYINFFLVGNKVKIQEYYGSGGYDPFDGKHDDYKPQKYYYYNEEENVVDTNNEDYYKNNVENNSNKNVEKNFNEEIVNNLEDNIKTESILYEKEINKNTKIRIVYKGEVLAQRSIIGIEKTTDGGNTWNQQLESADGFIQIHNGAEFIFLDENIGFINDPGLAGTDGQNRGLLVTTNGGKSFTDANIIHTNNIEEKNLFIKGVPYIEDGVLKVQIYTINHSKNPEKTYYEFYSEDNGLNWVYNKQLPTQ